jgi:1,2-diacylglycerol 3-alpha-glucosyltransferase
MRNWRWIIMNKRINIAIMEVYCGKCGKIGYYNSQELGLAKALAHHNFNVTIIFPNDDIIAIQEESINENITILNVPAHKFGTHAFYKLDILLDRNIQVVHLDSDNQAFAPSVMKFCKRNNIYVYNYIGTIYSDTNNRIKRAIMNVISYRNIRYFKKFKTFAKTPYVQEELISKGINNVELLSVGLDIDIIPEIMETKNELRLKFDLPTDKKIIVFIGRLEEYKKPFDAIELIKTLSNDYILIIIGKGPLKDEIFKKINNYGIEDKVIYIESITNKDIHQYFKLSDFFVNFNDKEIFGMSILEAMYQGCVVIAKRAPGPSYIIEDGVSGYLVDNIYEMNERIFKFNSILMSPDVIKDRIINNFTWEYSAKIIIRSINKLLKNFSI